MAVCDYVHLNPVRAKLLTPEQALKEYRWSSWREYLKSPGKRWGWLRVDRLLGEYRIPKDSAAGRRELERALERRAKGDAGKVAMAVRLPAETEATVKWIAERLQMGSVANMNTLLYHWQRGKKTK